MLKKTSIAFLLLLFCVQTIFSQSKEYRKISNTYFKKGELLKFDAYYHSMLTGRVSAGIVTLEVKDDFTKFFGRDAYHIVGLGKTKGFFNMFYKVIDAYDTYIDVEGIFPWKFIQRVNEGDYKIYRDIYFYHKEKTASVYKYNDDNKIERKKQVEVPEYTQDLLSSFYFARTFDLTDLKVGKEFPVRFILSDSVYVSKIIYQGMENVKIRMGTFRCMKFKPMLLKGKVFSEPYPMTIFITDDKNRIPILVESAVIVGSVKLELTNYKNLANPVTSKIK